MELLVQLVLQNIGYIGLNEGQIPVEVASFGEGKFKISARTALQDVQVSNATGELLKLDVVLSGSVAEIDLSEASSGVYFVLVKTEERRSILKLMR